MARTTIRITEDDTLVSLLATLKDTNGTVVDLTGATITFRMVLASDVTSVKIAAGAVTIDSATAGTVSYPWQSGDLDTPGEYYAWFIRTDTNPEHYPGDGKELLIIIGSKF